MANRLLPTKQRRTRTRAAPPRWGLTTREWRSVQRFRRRARAVLPNGEMKSVVLYGSRVYGKPRPGSDIDLFLVYDDVTPEQEQSLKELALDLDSEFMDVHVFLYRADRLARDITVSPLIYNVAHRGILLEGAPLPRLDIDRRHVAEKLIKDAKENLRLVQPVIDLGGYRNAISMSYYAVLYAADAALATKGFVAKSHAGTDSLFGNHFFRKGLVDRKFKGLVGRAAEERIKADYDHDVEFNRADAEYWFGRAQEFVAAIDTAMPNWLAEAGEQ
ncbi:MAG: HEPN domain-containing protein [Chloroflexi bacterium]|nr:HEPN domain-containing protein [Chloroflexota bacterium]